MPRPAGQKHKQKFYRLDSADVRKLSAKMSGSAFKIYLYTLTEDPYGNGLDWEYEKIAQELDIHIKTFRRGMKTLEAHGLIAADVEKAKVRRTVAGENPSDGDKVVPIEPGQICPQRDRSVPEKTNVSQKGQMCPKRSPEARQGKGFNSLRSLDLKTIKKEEGKVLTEKEESGIPVDDVTDVPVSAQSTQEKPQAIAEHTEGEAPPPEILEALEKIGVKVERPDVQQYLTAPPALLQQAIAQLQESNPPAIAATMMFIQAVAKLLAGSSTLRTPEFETLRTRWNGNRHLRAALIEEYRGDPDFIVDNNGPRWRDAA